MNLMMRGWRVVALALMAIGPLAHAEVVVVPLTRLPGTSAIWVTGLSSSGDFAVGYCYHNFETWTRWNRNGEPTSVGTVGSFSAIANSGLIGAGVTTGASPNTAFRWTPGTGIVSLGDIPGSNEGSSAIAISGDGTKIIGNGRGNLYAFRWTVETGIVELPGSFRARGASHDGNAVCGTSGGFGTRWSASTGTQLIPFPIEAVSSGSAYAISNDAGTVFGINSSSPRYLWRWTQEAGTQLISGPVPASLSPVGCSGDGGVMFAGPSGSLQIYYEPIGLIPIGTFLQSQGYVGPIGGSAIDISEDGRTLLTRDGVDNAYLFFLPRFIAGRVIFRDLAGGSAAPSQATIEFRLPGQTTPVATEVASLDAQGRYFIPSPDPVGNYDVSVKVGHWLRKTVAVDTASRSVISNVILRMANGDCDRDNEVGIGDYAILSAAYGTEFGDSGFSAMADLNEDLGVDIADYAILSANYGTQGDL